MILSAKCKQSSLSGQMVETVKCLKDAMQPLFVNLIDAHNQHPNDSDKCGEKAKQMLKEQLAKLSPLNQSFVYKNCLKPALDALAKSPSNC